MVAKRLAIRSPVAIACGAVLGIVAINGISMIVNAAPPCWDALLGEAFSVVVAGFVLLLVVRLLAALFSPVIRALVAAHKPAYTAAFSAAITLLAFAYLSQHGLMTGAAWDQWGIRWLQQPRHSGRTLAQWLRILTTKPGRSGSPLDIIHTHVYTNLHTTVLELPLSYDLMSRHGFYGGRRNALHVTMDGDHRWKVPILRGTNGDCLLPLNWDEGHISPGLHRFTVGFLAGELMLEVGATQAVVFANEPRSGSPLDIVRTQVGTNLHTAVLELPLPYDLLREPNLLNGHGKIAVTIDKRYFRRSIPPVRGTNGNCLLVLNRDREKIPPGRHEVQVELWIDRYLFAEGPARAIAFDNSATLR
jgi:hypothetical protein